MNVRREWCLTQQDTLFFVFKFLLFHWLVLLLFTFQRSKQQCVKKQPPCQQQTPLLRYDLTTQAQLSEMNFSVTLTVGIFFIFNIAFSFCDILGSSLDQFHKFAYKEIKELEDVNLDATTSITTQRLPSTKKRTVKPGPQCYYCVNNCKEDWTSDQLQTCTADQICVRKMVQLKNQFGETELTRSSGCTYECKIGVIVSPAFNLTLQCCSSYKDTRCDIGEYSAAGYAAVSDYRLPKPTIFIIAIINIIMAYFF